MRTMFWLAIGLLAPAAHAGQSQVGVYANLHPGASLKAEVDLNLGEPLRKLEDYLFEYAPPRGMPDTERVVASFFPDTRQVARLDVYLKAPVDPELLRSQFGTRVMVRNRGDGQSEELFYPKLHALVFAARGSAGPVAAIGYLSPRLMADYYVERVQGMLRENRYDEAQTEADKAVLVDPDYARGYLEQGECWIGQKNYNEAIVSFLAGANAKYSPRYRAAAHARLGALYWKEKNWPDKARPEFLKAVALAADLDEARYRFGEFLRAQKLIEEALGELSAAVKLNPRHVPARAELAAIYFSRAEYGKALPHYAALSTASGSAEPSGPGQEAVAGWHYRYGVCLSQARNGVQAIQAYRKALERDPRLLAAWHRLGLEYQAAGSFDKALESFRSGLHIDRQNFGLNQSLGEALLESGQAEAARRQMEVTLRLKPDDPTARFHMARCWAALGKKKQAVQWVQQAIAAGYKDRARLTGDPFLGRLQKDGDFKKALQPVL